MFCSCCGAEVLDGKKYCPKCGARYDAEKDVFVLDDNVVEYNGNNRTAEREDESKSRTSIILIVSAIIGVVVCVILLVLIIVKNKTQELSQTTELKKLEDNTTVQEKEETSIEDESNEVEEDKGETIYYFVKKIEKDYLGTVETEEFEYDFNNRTVTVPSQFMGDLIRPEVETSGYEQDISYHCYLNHITPLIKKYICKNDDVMIGEEEIEFDENGNISSCLSIDHDMIPDNITEYDVIKNDEIDTHKNGTSSNYYVSYNDEGLLVTNGLSDAYIVEYSYDSKGRIIRKKCDVYYEGSYYETSVEYNDSDKTATLYNAEHEPLGTFYYDECGQCYKVEQGDYVINYEYIKVIVDSNGNISVDDSFDNEVVEETTSSTEPDENAVKSSKELYQPLMDDYKKTLEGSMSDQDFIGKYGTESFMILNDSSSCVYSFKDITGDGIEELFLDGCGTFMVFTIKDGQYCNVLNIVDYRWQMYLCDDNSFYSVGTASAASNYYEHWLLNENGTGVCFKDGYTFDANEKMYEGNYDFENDFYDDSFWYYTTDQDGDISNDTPSSYSEAQSFIQDMESKVMNLDYSPISGY
ncbi:MAG: zinc ribbon domain-containing protein [Eubacterium sp.]|nr:zinc ribbon domain-containing protein [Eubacterium sp.]